jgi:hypothetical protein
MHGQKKTALGVTGLSLLFILLAAGCEQATSSDPESRGEGVLGRLYGVVVNSVTGQPFEGVEVALRGSAFKALTDTKGQYLIKDVPIGADYVLTYTKAPKEGEPNYRFHTKDDGTAVDPGQYKWAAPFFKYGALKAQLPQMLAEQSLGSGNGGSITMTFTNGIWVKEDGTAVQVTNGGVKDVKMNFTYRPGQGLSVTRLAPLTGGIKGTIKLFKAVYADAKNVKLDEAVPAANTEFWLKETGIGGNTYREPFKSAAEGVIVAEGLPVGVNMMFTTNGFVSDGYYYKSQAYVYNGVTNEFIAVPADFFATLKGQAQLEPVYLFAEPDYALVTAFTAGTSAAPLARDGSITLTFTKAIDPAAFSADLVYDNGPSASPSGTVPLLASWSGDYKTVTLKGGLASGASTEGFPYSANGGKPVGKLNISGKAADGSIIFAEDTNTAASVTGGLPVFTQEGLKATLDLAPTGIPTSRAVVSSSAVKLTFNKAVNPDTANFKWGTKNADYSFAPGNTSVFIWTDLLTTGTTGETLFWTVAAAADPFDDISGNSSEQFTKAPANRLLTLASTNIYANRTDSGPLSSSTEASFPLAGAITLTFTRAIPAGSKVQAALQKTNAPSSFTSSPLDVTVNWTSGAVVTITPAVHLDANSTYYLKLAISNGLEALFDGASLSGYNGTKLQWMSTARTAPSCSRRSRTTI